MMSLLFKFHGLLEGMDSKNSSNQIVSSNNTPTMVLPIFPAMLFEYQRPREYSSAQKYNNKSALICFKDITVKAFCRCLLVLTGTDILLWQQIMIEILL